MTGGRRARDTANISIFGTLRSPFAMALWRRATLRTVSRVGGTSCALRLPYTSMCHNSRNKSTHSVVFYIQIAVLADTMSIHPYTHVGVTQIPTNNISCERKM